MLTARARVACRSPRPGPPQLPQRSGSARAVMAGRTTNGVLGDPSFEWQPADYYRHRRINREHGGGNTIAPMRSIQR